MHVPVVVIDRISEIDRKTIRTELRRNQFTAYEVDKNVIAITGQIQRVRKIAERFAIVGVPRCRYLYVDGAELDEAHEQPGQFKIIGSQKISSFGPFDRDTGWRLYEAFKHHGIEAGIVDHPSGLRSVLAEFSPVVHYLIQEICEEELKGYDFVGLDRAGAPGGSDPSKN